ncbi:MAG: hypothetical protein NTW87_04280 [Planctomycetota bacterium]|nr:hypothetical protein [Planctomycetota bacterium]
MDETNMPSARVPTPHKGQQQLLDLPGRVRVAVCGRRFGKTVGAAIAAVRKCQGGSTPKRVWWIAPVQGQCDAVEEQIAEWVAARTGRIPPKHKNEQEEGKTEDADVSATPTPAPASQDKPSGDEDKPAWYHRRSAHELYYAGNGSRIEFHSAHVPDRLRGAGLDLVVVDEAADVSEYTWNKVIRPMLFDRRGEAFIIGTPRGTQNWLHRVYLMGQSAEHAGRYASLQLPTSASPHIAPEEIEDYRREMTPEEFAQECEAQFIDGADSVFTKVTDAVSGEPLTRGRPGETYVTGIDLGDRADYTVLCSVAVGPERLEGFARLNKSSPGPAWWTRRASAIPCSIRSGRFIAGTSCRSSFRRRARRTSSGG